MQHSDPYELALYIIKLVSVSLGLVFLFFTLRAYRKHRTRPMLVLMLAIVLMVLASVSEGASGQFIGLSLKQSHVVEAIFTLAAFAVLVWSILVPHRSGDLDITTIEEEEHVDAGENGP